MAIKVKSLAPWRETRNTLAKNLASTFEFLVDKPASADPNSDHRRGQAAVRRILGEMEKLAVDGLKQIDDEVASSNLVTEISALSKEAKREADRLKQITKTIERITGAIDAVTGVVTKIAGLPFL